jgi:hypothetical protein
MTRDVIVGMCASGVGGTALGVLLMLLICL